MRRAVNFTIIAICIAPERLTDRLPMARRLSISR